MKQKRISIELILKALGNLVITTHGSMDNAFIDNLADPQNTNENTLDWVNSIKANKQEIVENSLAKVIIVDKDIIFSDLVREKGKFLIVVENPKMAFSILGNSFFVEKIKPEIHALSVIHPEAEIAANVSISPFVHIGNAKIGEGTVISSFVRIYDNVVIGKNCFIKEGAVIGGGGFGYEKDESGNRFRFPHIGGVVIGDEVEIGANTCIDRGALSNTFIDDHAKIDNLCHISHNVQLGKNVMITACSEISGSCVLGDEVWTGPNTSIRDHRKVGKNALIGIGSVVVKDVPEGEIWIGNPANSLKKRND